MSSSEDLMRGFGAIHDLAHGPVALDAALD